MERRVHSSQSWKPSNTGVYKYPTVLLGFYLYGSSSNQTPAADQIDSDEDSDGTRIPTRIAAAAAAAGGGDADLQGGPTRFYAES